MLIPHEDGQAWAIPAAQLPPRTHLGAPLAWAVQVYCLLWAPQTTAPGTATDAGTGVPSQYVPLAQKLDTVGNATGATVLVIGLEVEAEAVAAFRL